MRPDDYLKCYADRYRVAKAADGFWEILTKLKARDGLAFTVYVYSDTHLAALLPPLAGTSLLRRYPDRFTVHQEATDGKVLLFREEDLHDLADALKLRRRRHRKPMSDAEREKLVTAGQQFRFVAGHKSERAA